MEQKAPEVIRDPKILQKKMLELKKEGKTVGLVPTMGALHPGHLSLALSAKSECSIAVVSIFVNPTQFGPTEDFDQYPRTFEADMELLTQIGIDFVYAPTPETMYSADFNTFVEVGTVTTRLEGKRRPGHFLGVATVVLKLFNIVCPDVAYFGQKDYQQVAVIRKMVNDLNVPTEIRMCPIIREKDGLAMSSRNHYLSQQERKDALCLYEALGQAEYMIHTGTRDADEIKAEMRRIIEAVPSAELDYIAIVQPETLREIEWVAGNVAVLLAVRIGKTRLIDNMLISFGEGQINPM